MLPESRWKNNSKNHTSDTKCAESVELSANAAWQIPHFLFQKGVHKNSLISDSAPEAQTARARPTTTMSELTAHQLTEGLLLCASMSAWGFAERGTEKHTERKKLLD